MQQPTQTLLGLNGGQAQLVEDILAAAGINDLKTYLREIEDVAGKELLDRVLVAHWFPYRTLRLLKDKTGRGKQIRDLISEMTSQQLATTCDQAERYGVNDATDWMRWAELNGIRVSWTR